MAIITNTASLSGFVNGEEVAAGSNTAIWNLEQAADVTFLKEPETGTITPNVPFPVTLTITNTGTEQIYGIVVRDPIDPSLTLVPGSVTLNGTPLDPSQYTFVDGVLVVNANIVLEAGESAVIGFQVITD